MKRTLLALTILTIAVSSCTIEKRLHRGGWHVEWKGNYRGTHDDKTSDRQSESLADTPIEKEPIRTTEAPVALTEKKVAEKKPTESSQTKHQADEQTISTETTESGPAASTQTETTPRVATDEVLVSDGVSDNSIEKIATATEATPAAEELLPIDPVMIAAYILSALILLMILVFLVMAFAPLPFGVAGVLDWLPFVVYFFAAIGNIVLLVLTAIRKETMNKIYRYLPTWPIWVITFLPLFVTLILLIAFIIVWGW